MTLDAKKLNIIQWILGVNNEEVVDRLSISVNDIKTQSLNLGSVSFTTFSQIKNNKFDLAAIKQKQNYQPFAAGELDALIKEADVQESITELLESLD